MKRILIKRNMSRMIQIVMGILAVFYILYAFSLLILGSNYRSFGLGWSRYNLIPFKTISIYLFNPQDLSWGIIFDNLIGNILVFMPLGFFLALFFKGMRHVIQITVFSFIMTVMVEMTQGFLGVGSVDVDDVILNTLGGFVGYICFLVVYKVFYLFFDWQSF